MLGWLLECMYPDEPRSYGVDGFTNFFMGKVDKVEGFANAQMMVGIQNALALVKG